MSPTYGRATLGANGTPNKLFIEILFRDYDGVQFLKVVVLNPNSIFCCKCGSQMFWFVGY